MMCEPVDDPSRDVPVPTIQNIVSTVNLDCRLNLTQIALKARNAEYNPKRFAAVIMRIREPKTTALIFATGKMVCTGAKSEQSSKVAARKFARIIQKLGFPAKFKDFKIQNIVASCDIKFPLDLVKLDGLHGAFTTYEPEIFPGLIYRMKQPKIVLLMFISGKIVLTGAKIRDQTYTAFENIYPVLTEFRKTTTMSNALDAGQPAVLTKSRKTTISPATPGQGGQLYGARQYPSNFQPVNQTTVPPKGYMSKALSAGQPALSVNSTTGNGNKGPVRPAAYQNLAFNSNGSYNMRTQSAYQDARFANGPPGNNTSTTRLSNANGFA